jgi:hypothetical protein
MDKVHATELKRLAVTAVEDLSRVLRYAEANCSLKELERLKKGVGLSIGAIEMNLMTQLYEQFPELED